MDITRRRHVLLHSKPAFWVAVVRLAKHSHIFEMLPEGFGVIPYQCRYHLLYLILLTLLKTTHKNVKKGFSSLSKISRLAAVAINAFSFASFWAVIPFRVRGQVSVRNQFSAVLTGIFDILVPSPSSSSPLLFVLAG